MSAIERCAEILETVRSFSGDAVLATNYTDDSITRGFGFQVRRVISVTTAETRKIVLDTRGVAYNKAVFILPLEMGGTGGPILVKTYLISDYSGGTEMPSSRLNARSPLLAGAKVVDDITSSDTPGNDLREYVFGATGNPQQVARAGGGGGSVPLIPPKDAIICLEIDNQYTDTIQFGIDLIWFEVLFS